MRGARRGRHGDRERENAAIREAARTAERLTPGRSRDTRRLSATGWSTSVAVYATFDYHLVRARPSLAKRSQIAPFAIRGQGRAGKRFLSTLCSCSSGANGPRGARSTNGADALSRHGAQILALARRYTASGDDAEDAYQRAIEILLTKAPTTREEELVPWLKTVVKHEAFALRRQRERLTPVTSDGEPVERGTAPTATHEQAERYERLRQGAEALRRLKPQEIRCLVLRAQGLSYREICEMTGFTYTKVNRCLTEGRQALSARLAGIEGGIECERLAPQLSALADGEADAQALALLRPHLKTCLSCRARLREFRAAPARVAALVPAAAMVGGGGGGLRGAAESALGASPAEGRGATRRGTPQDGLAPQSAPRPPAS